MTAPPDDIAREAAPPTAASRRARLEIFALDGLPEVAAGDDLAELICRAMATAGQHLIDQDIVVVAQKIVSKAEGRRRALSSVTPDVTALRVGAETEKDPRLVSLVLDESSRIVRQRSGLLITEHRTGHIMANAGIDQSNVGPDAAESVLLLPAEPDASARALCARLRAATAARLGVVIADSFGRPWRLGTVGTAIGVAGPPALVDERGRADRGGRRLLVTEIGLADEVAAAASLVMGQADEGRPVAIVRGLAWADSTQSAADLIRPAEQDLFR